MNDHGPNGIWNKANTGRKFVVPKLHAAGGDNDPQSLAEPWRLTTGQIAVHNRPQRKTPRRAAACGLKARPVNRGRDKGFDLAPPSKPDWRISRIRLSSQWFPVRD